LDSPNPKGDLVDMLGILPFARQIGNTEYLFLNHLGHPYPNNPTH